MISLRSCQLSTFLIALVPAAVSAQVVTDCQWEGTAQAIVEPWEDNTRTFANGKTRLALMDFIEPGTGPLRLLVLSPPYDELGGRQCKGIAASWTHGFAAVYWEGLQAGYDPARGLLFDLPVAVYDDALGDATNQMLSFTLNQSTGALDAVLNPAD